MQQNSTLKKLAETLQLSVSTVSRALKNHPDISAETKRRVQELAEAMDYEPNSFAVHLRNKTSNIFGIMVPSINNFFYDSFIAAVEQDARLHQYSVLIVQSGESADAESANLKLLKNNRIAGIFVSITQETKNIDLFLKVQEQNIPVLFFDRVPDYSLCNKICMADKTAANTAALALIANHKKNVLALFSHLNLSISKKRLQSFQQTFSSNAPDARLIFGFPLSVEEAKNITAKALEESERPDAIFCMVDEILIGAMQAVYQKGLKVPDDIAVISISNGFIPTIYNPAITYVETSGYKLGKLAFKRMMSCIKGNTFLQEITLESMLVEGGSL